MEKVGGTGGQFEKEGRSEGGTGKNSTTWQPEGGRHATLGGDDCVQFDFSRLGTILLLDHPPTTKGLPFYLLSVWLKDLVVTRKEFPFVPSTTSTLCVSFWRDRTGGTRTHSVGMTIPPCPFCIQVIPTA